MATKDFPSGLPLPRRAGYVVTDSNATRTSDTMTGPPVVELISEDVPSYFNVNWLLTLAQFQVFEGWFKYTLAKGSKLFNISLNVGKGLESHECYFLSPYSARQIGKLWNVTASLVALTKQLDTEDHYNDVLIFLNGIDTKDELGLLNDIVQFANVDLPDAWGNIEYGTDFS